MGICNLANEFLSQKPVHSCVYFIGNLQNHTTSGSQRHLMDGMTCVARGNKRSLRLNAPSANKAPSHYAPASRTFASLRSAPRGLRASTAALNPRGALRRLAKVLEAGA